MVWAPCLAASAPSIRFIFGLPMKPATKRLRGRWYSSSGLPTCSMPPGVQDDDLVGHGHRLDLIVGHVDHRGLQRLVQFGDFLPHAHPQRGVKVRQRLVEQEGRRFAHDGAADGDALALAARKLARAAVKVVGQVQDLGRAFDPLVLLGLGPSRPSSAGRRCSCAPSCAGKAHSSGTPSPGRAWPGGRAVASLPSIVDDAARWYPPAPRSGAAGWTCRSPRGRRRRRTRRPRWSGRRRG